MAMKKAAPKRNKKSPVPARGASAKLATKPGNNMPPRNPTAKNASHSDGPIKSKDVAVPMSHGDGGKNPPTDGERLKSMKTTTKDRAKKPKRNIGRR